tara:strand:- start:486 stop:1340 length:855 start_codon:yes stop_codon:yes gene_type:complete
MNYILVNFGEIPNHLKFCIKNIEKVDKNSNIILATDKSTSIEDIQNINLEEIDTPYLNEIDESIKNLNYFDNEENILWEASLKRIFAILDVALMLDIDNFVHFDNDVLIYKSFNELQNEFSKEKINITQVSNIFLNFSYSYFPKILLLKNLADKVFEIFSNVEFYEKKYYEGNRLNEMVILNIVYKLEPTLFNILNSLPNKKSSILFDPASYGQYLSGFHNKKKSRKKRLKEMSTNQYLGEDMYINKYKPEFKKTGPIVRYENKTYEVANLHIHNKKLKKYLIK